MNIVRSLRVLLDAAACGASSRGENLSVGQTQASNAALFHSDRQQMVIHRWIALGAPNN